MTSCVVVFNFEEDELDVSHDEKIDHLLLEPSAEIACVQSNAYSCNLQQERLDDITNLSSSSV